MRNIEAKFFPFDTTNLQDPISDEDNGNDSDYDEGFFDEDDWFSPIGATQSRSTSSRDNEASGFSRNEVREYEETAAEDSFYQQPDVDAGWHEYLQSLSSTSNTSQASEHSNEDFSKLGARPKDRKQQSGIRPSFSQQGQQRGFISPTAGARTQLSRAQILANLRHGMKPICDCERETREVYSRDKNQYFWYCASKNCKYCFREGYRNK